MFSGFEIKNNSSGTIVKYNRGEDFCNGLYHEAHTQAWQKALDEKFEKLSDNKDNKALSKDDFFQIYAENDSDYISNELSKYLDNLQDLNGNKNDFNSLNTKQQSLILSFLRAPLEQSDTYGTHANLSDIKIDINQESLYIEANIHTIDGNVLSSAAEFSPQKMDQNKYGNYGFLEHDDSEMYKFSFVSDKNLNTSERKNLIANIKSADEKKLSDFKENIDISIYYDNDGTEGGFSNFSLYSQSNLELDIDQAMQNVKNLPKEKNNEDKENQKFTLLNLYWDNFKKDLENFDELYKNKQENPLFKNSISPLKDILKAT